MNNWLRNFSNENHCTEMPGSVINYVVHTNTNPEFATNYALPRQPALIPLRNSLNTCPKFHLLLRELNMRHFGCTPSHQPLLVCYVLGCLLKECVYSNSLLYFIIHMFDLIIISSLFQYIFPVPTQLYCITHIQTKQITSFGL